MIRFNFTAAAVILGVVAIGATAAEAQSRKTRTLPETAMTPPTQSLGGPIRQGNFCWVSTDQRGFGYWRNCTATGNEAYASAVNPGYPMAPQQAPDDAYAAAREDSANMLGGSGGDSGGGDSGGGGDAGAL